MGKKSLFWPVMIGVVIIAIIIYLVANLKQPYVTCNIRNNNDVATVDEKLLVTFNSDTISNIKYDKTVYLNDKYKESVHTNSIKENFDRAYKYLGDSYSLRIDNNVIYVNINLDKKVPVILNNIEIYYNEGDGIVTKIETNTKASGVTTLSVGDKYSEGQFMTKLKNKGYDCK